jgi:hypothetical protein
MSRRGSCIEASLGDSFLPQRTQRKAKERKDQNISERPNDDKILTKELQVASILLRTHSKLWHYEEHSDDISG